MELSTSFLQTATSYMYDRVLNTPLFSQVLHTAEILLYTSVDKVERSYLGVYKDMRSDSKISFLLTSLNYYDRDYSFNVFLIVRQR